MDKLSEKTIKEMTGLTELVENTDVKITQDLKTECLLFEDVLGRKTKMYCRHNSVIATVHQWLGHLFKGTLFSYDDPNYEIGACFF